MPDKLNDALLNNWYWLKSDYQRHKALYVLIFILFTGGVSFGVLVTNLWIGARADSQVAAIKQSYDEASNARMSVLKQCQTDLATATGKLAATSDRSLGAAISATEAAKSATDAAKSATQAVASQGENK